MVTAIARPNTPKNVPAFVVREDDRKRTRSVYTMKDGKMQKEDVKDEGGYIVSFPAKGHSMRVRTEDELKRLGFDQTIPIVDLEHDDNDEPVGYVQNSVTSSTRSK